MSGMWGTGSWGTGSWGGVAISLPSLAAVDNVLCDVKGGTVLGIYGTNFFPPALIELLTGITVVGTAYYFDADLDLRLGKILAGFPALPVGSYGLRVTTPAGPTAILPNAVTYAVFAEEGKAHRVRRRFGEAWALGRRVLA